MTTVARRPDWRRAPDLKGIDVSTLTIAPSAPPRTLRLHVPVTLPPNHRGEPLRKLSYTAVDRFRGCPDDYRRCYLLGEWGPKTGDMFVGSRVDDAISGYFRAQLSGSTLDLDAVMDLYNELWKRELAYETARNGPVRFSTRRNEEQTHALGLQAVRYAMAKLVPHLGRPIAVQRRFEFKLAPALQWSVVGTADLDTIREQTVYLIDDGTQHPEIREHGRPEPMISLPYRQAPAAWRPPVTRRKETLEPREAIALFERDSDEHQERLARWRDHGEDGPEPKAPKPLPDVDVPVSELTVETVRREVAGVADFKVTGRPWYRSTAGDSLQASVYLGERWLAGDPAFDFSFAQVLKPGANGRVNMGTSIVPTRRTEAELRATFMRLAQTASLIWAAYRRFGAHEPWGWVTEDWRCRNCNHGLAGTRRCPFVARSGA
jgi:hypothetical protein